MRRFLCFGLVALLLCGCGGGGPEGEEDWDLFDANAKLELPLDVGWVGVGVGGVEGAELAGVLNRAAIRIVAVNREGLPGSYAEAATATRADCEQVVKAGKVCMGVTTSRDGEGAAMGKELFAVDTGTVLCDLKSYSGGTLQAVVTSCLQEVSRREELKKELAKRR